MCIRDRVIGDQVETIVCIGAGCHIDVCTAADSDDALSADGIAVEGMPRPGSAHWEGPSISPSLRIIGCALGRFQPPFLLGQVIESEEAEEAINSCFFILDIGVVAGTAAIFQVQVSVLVRPFAGAQSSFLISLPACLLYTSRCV